MTPAADGAGRLDLPALLAALTLEEKASLLDGSDFWHTKPVERLGIPAIMVTDGPHGLRKQAEGADHLGLRPSVPATCFPPGRRAGLQLGRRAPAPGSGRRSAASAAHRDVAVLLGPGVNIKRSPLCGRNFEYFSEDPHPRRRPRRRPGRRASSPRASAPRSSTSRRTTRRPTG